MSCPTTPLPLPADFTSPSDGSRVMETINMPLAEKCTLTSLESQICSLFQVDLTDAIASIFCATVSRIVGHPDGQIGYSKAPGNFQILCFNISPGDTISDLILAQFKNVRHHDSQASRLIITCHEEQDSALSAVDCTWLLVPNEHGDLGLRITFNRNVYCPTSLETYAQVFGRFIHASASDPQLNLTSSPICTPADILQLGQWNRTAKEPFHVSSVSELFRRTAANHPDNIAVTNGGADGMSLTYQELDRWSDGLALWLIDHGFGGPQETIVGIWQSRDVMLVVSYIACLKAGCAFMPLEMNLPADRIRIMLETSESPLVFVNNPPFDFPCTDFVQCIDVNGAEIRAQLSQAVDSHSLARLPIVTPERLAYIIFTSGSTGVPKAVMLQHSCLLNFALWDIDGFTSDFRTPLMLSIAFDVSVGEIWMPLAHGATLVCHKSGDTFDLADFLEKEKISGFIAATPLLRALLDVGYFARNLPSLRYIGGIGDPMYLETMGVIMQLKPTISLVNWYGPSEATIFITEFIIPRDYRRKNISIGHATPNSGCYAVDDNLNPVPPGVCGELFVTGENLARGYFGQPQATAAKFIQLDDVHPLGAIRGYRTGDLVRQLSTGDFEFLRRKDDGQVKLRGYRIELGEIEHVLKLHSDVTSVLVVLCERGNNNGCIVAYLISASTLDIDGLRATAKSRMPAYMIPSIFLQVPAFALTPTGKLDRKTMSSPDFVQQMISTIPANTIFLTPHESNIRKLFAEALGINEKSLGLEDSFFDLGGNSLIAVRIVTSIRRSFSVTLTMSAFMDHATVSGVSRLIMQKRDDKRAHSHEQTNLWVEEQMNPGLATYNTGFQRKFRGPFNVAAMLQAMIALLSRHDALRMRFEMQGETLFQRVHPYKYKSEGDDIIRVHKVDDDGLARAILAENAARIFDLSSDFPIRVAIVTVSATTHFISVIIHHIVTDGWSAGLIDTDLALLYNTFLDDPSATPPLEPLPFTFGDATTWRSQVAGSQLVEDQLQYWTTQLRGSRPLELFTDYIRPSKLSGRAAELEFNIDSDTLTALRRLASVHRTSLYVILLAAFRALIYRSNGVEDGMLGMINANRPLPELNNIVGFFVNSHALRLVVSPDSTFADLIQVTRKVVMDALEHSDATFRDVVAALSPERNIARKSLIQLGLVLQDFTGASDNRFGKDLRNITPEEIRVPSSNLDLSIHLFSEETTLHGYMMYQTDLFSHETVSTILDNFQRVLRALVASPRSNIASMDMLTPADLVSLENWNCTDVDSILPKSLVHGFRSTVAAYRSSLAVDDGSISLTYEELDQRSDRLASWLAMKGVQKGSVVGVSMPRSSLLVVAYLSCLKAGLVYMPLDKSLPPARMRAMAQMANCQLFLTSGDCLLKNEIECVNLNDQSNILLATPIVPLLEIDEDAISCVIFTSGSTGVPKGCVVKQKGMVNLCSPNTTQWPGRARNALSSSIAFDPSGFQIFTSLLTGAPLCCLPDEGVFNPRQFVQALLDFDVQRCYLTPSMLSSLMVAGDNDWLEQSSLEVIFLGGEKLDPLKIMEVLRRKPTIRISSSYGPAEASVRSASYEQVSDLCASPLPLRQIPLGRPLRNTQIYVVDRNLHPVPAGMVGQIILSGPHLNPGYVNQPEQTAKVYKILPSSSELGARRIYLTGDLGYWTSEGQLQFVGRADKQVKVRGQRLETSEVERALESHPYVKASSVVVVKDEERELLVGYVVLSGVLTNPNDLVEMWTERYNEDERCEDWLGAPEQHDSVRWRSMLNGSFIPPEQMDEWLDDAIQQIDARPSDRVLEIGVGTGQIALKLVDRVAHFTGVDLSRPAIDYLQSQVDQRGFGDKTALHVATAHEFSRPLSDCDFSLVIINSVAQYFPSGDYLADVIKQASQTMKSGGRIFLGDIRSYGLIEYHNTQRALGSLPGHASVIDVRKMLEGFSTTQTELLLNPSFFFNLQHRLPGITHVEILPKVMSARNELSRYRYTVVLHVAEQPTLIKPSTWVDFSTVDTPVQELRSVLRDSDESAVGLTKIRVLDLERIYSLRTQIDASDAEEAVASLHSHLVLSLGELSSPHALRLTAAQEGWTAFFDHSVQGFGSDCNYLQAIFVRTSSLPTTERSIAGGFDVPAILPGPKSESSRMYAKHFPPYMVPHIVTLDAFPLTVGGKMDSRLLASAQFFDAHDEEKSSQRTIESPVTETERQVLEIFSRVLKRPADRIDTQESLFNLGGHSLMATIVVAIIRRELGVEVSMATFFLHPCVRDVAANIDSLRSTVSLESGSSGTYIDIASLARTTLTVNQDRSDPTLFMFPESTGFASAYSSAFPYISRKVVAFGDERWGKSIAPKETIHSIAAAGVAKILEHQPTGPYYLSGWSLGGFVALEAAVQLQALGASVALVVLFDSRYRSTKGNGEWEDWTDELDPLLALFDGKEQWLTQLNRANKLVVTFSLPPDAFSGRVVLFRAMEDVREGEAVDGGGWEECLPQIEVWPFHATHRNMFDQQNGKKIGMLLNELM
ncbi:Amino acid adenylation domain-containing protein [Mycena sanguinolenta]|uniref:Amino acid adenylation domain-containing protein n=1 Tax=Mycena sanguinolenta TaxID=230812 RepID=A0A8H6XBT1_9AGAR|nr:Amino acid adenylation domain-containing protein [Mycena sanguinolenta]